MFNFGQKLSPILPLPFSAPFSFPPTLPPFFNGTGIEPRTLNLLGKCCNRVSPSQLYCLLSCLPYEVCQFTIVRPTLVRSTSPFFIFSVIKSFLESFLCSESSWTVRCLFNTKSLTLHVNGREAYTSAFNFTHHSWLYRFVPDYKCIIFIYNFGTNLNKQIKIT